LSGFATLVAMTFTAGLIPAVGALFFQQHIAASSNNTELIQKNAEKLENELRTSIKIASVSTSINEKLMVANITNTSAMPIPIGALNWLKWEDIEPSYGVWNIVGRVRQFISPIVYASWLWLKDILQEYLVLMQS
jgi:hypothetical protein